MITEEAQQNARQTEQYLQKLFLQALSSEEGQKILYNNARRAMVDLSRDVHEMVRALSTVASAQFVIANIPLHLGMTHEQLRGDAVMKAPTNGLFLEFGVWQGKWLNWMAKERAVTFYGFDSFEGIPEDWSVYNAGTFDLQGRLPIVEPNVVLVKGWFSDSLPKFLELHREPVSFVHIDCDLYSSTKTVLQHLHPRLRVGTQIVLDDFMLEPAWEKAEHKAFFDFINYSGIEFKYTGYSGCSAGVVLTRIPG